MSPPGGVDELNMHGDVIPLHRDALKLRRSRRELHPRPNRHRSAVRSRRLPREVNFHRREPYRARGTRDLLGTGRHLLVGAICVAAVGTHGATLEHTFDYAAREWSLRCGKTAGGFATRAYP